MKKLFLLLLLFSFLGITACSSKKKLTCPAFDGSRNTEKSFKTGRLPNHNNQRGNW